MGDLEPFFESADYLRPLLGVTGDLAVSFLGFSGEIGGRALFLLIGFRDLSLFLFLAEFLSIRTYPATVFEGLGLPDYSFLVFLAPS